MAPRTKKEGKKPAGAPLAFEAKLWATAEDDQRWVYGAPPAGKEFSEAMFLDQGQAA